MLLPFTELAEGQRPLLGVRPAAQFGSTEAGCWAGLYWHPARPGGVILLLDEAGRPEAAEALTDLVLQAAWRGMTGDSPARPWRAAACELPRAGSRAGARRPG